MSSPIRLEGIEVDLGTRNVITDVSLDVRHGEILAILGPSGSGKTTLLRTVTGFVAPRRGRVVLGERIASDGGRILIGPEGRDLAMVFQDLALWPHLTVRDNLAFGLDAQRVAPAERDRRIAAMLARVGLAAQSTAYPGRLSGGERQRVAIARALVLEPAAVLFDEPLTNLDIVLKRDLLHLVRSLLRERGTAAVYVTHDPMEARSLGDRVAIMEGGRLVQVGTVDELERAPQTSFVAMLFARDEGR